MEIPMDPYSAHTIATSRHADLVREADDARLAKAAKKAAQRNRGRGSERQARVVRPATA